jgi:methionyl-tRNA formyltransferase
LRHAPVILSQAKDLTKSLFPQFMTAAAAQTTSRETRIVFIGTGEIGVPTLQNLLHSDEHQLVGVVTQPDKPTGRSQKLTAPPIKVAMAGSAIPILQPDRIKSFDAIDTIREWNSDVIVVMAYGQILPRAVLELPRIACLNLHASLLPRHRGAAPIQAAIVAGDPETGITVMYMDEGLDTGDILLQTPLEISPNETGESLHERLGRLAPDSLNEALRRLGKGTAERRPQNPAQATYAAKLTRDDGRIDWADAAQSIERKIRAFNPWPGAFTRIKQRSGREQRLKIFRAQIENRNGSPGEILQADSGRLIVAAGQNALSLGKVQLEGKWPMNAADFLRGYAGLLDRKMN